MNACSFCVVTKHRYEHEIIKNIVEDISIKIGRLPLPVADFPVGLEFPVSKVISLLEMDSTDQVHMERIHGIGGIGKITLALALYNLIADNFEGVCFLENLRETSQKYGLVHLQNNLFCKMLGKEGVKIIGVKEGISQIQHRWKKALKEVAGLSGHHFKDGHRYEHEFIKNIMEDISGKIVRLPLPVANFPVGLEFPMSKIISLLEMDSTDRIHMVGIHGIGGKGKISSCSL
ncbi:hypothetical protein Ahy_B05g074460 [Arachis hypogaea]|uniref:NB-ARC domain-containing protein n=1 Tax=Arachis hypogaea TaxID=3818 RepID=A0A444YYW1_ARAHY|nr:hypothetical protein Ahy_B05g074460 [Arachis hypogaea]